MRACFQNRTWRPIVRFRSARNGIDKKATFKWSDPPVRGGLFRWRSAIDLRDSRDPNGWGTLVTDVSSQGTQRGRTELLLAAALCFLAAGCGGSGSAHRTSVDEDPREEGGAGGAATGGSSGARLDAGAAGAGGAAVPEDASAPAPRDAQPAPADSAGVDATGAATVPVGLGPWTGKDNVPPSADPPGGLRPDQVPQLVAIGFDDNQEAAGMNALTGLFRELKNPAGSGQADTFDGAPVRATFYITSSYGSNQATLRSWITAFQDGHEIGNHTIAHGDGFQYDLAKWQSEINGCNSFLKGNVKVSAKDLVGFRAPFLHYTALTYEVLQELGFWYDCSVEDGFQAGMDGTNYLWPYTLDGGSPGVTMILERDKRYKAIGNYPGLWELPDHPVIVPPDAECAKYGVMPGLRARVKAVVSKFSVDDGKATGLDYNVWDEYKMSNAEYVATLKYTLDLRLRGNRSPFMFGGHSVYYSNAGHLQALQEFVKYALSKPNVRFVPLRRILEWVRNPVPLR
jgi:peptidoglycan/xylan/chitin deacetylase (PgdA/CDA1 family)